MRRRCCYHRPTTCSARSTNHHRRFHRRSHHFFTHRRTPEGRCDAPRSPALSVASGWASFLSSPIAGLPREGAMSRISGTISSQWLGLILSSPIAGLPREGAMVLDFRHTLWPVAGPHSFLHPLPDSRGKVRCSWISGTISSQWLGLIPFFTHHRTLEGRCDGTGFPAHSVASGWASFLSSPIAGLPREGAMLLDLWHTQ